MAKEVAEGLLGNDRGCDGAEVAATAMGGELAPDEEAASHHDCEQIELSGQEARERTAEMHDLTRQALATGGTNAGCGEKERRKGSK